MVFAFDNCQMSFHGHPPGLCGTTTGLDLFPHFIKLPSTNTSHFPISMDFFSSFVLTIKLSLIYGPLHDMIDPYHVLEAPFWFLFIKIHMLDLAWQW